MKKYSKKLLIEILAIMLLVNAGVFLWGKEPTDTSGRLRYHINAQQPLELEVYISDSEIIDASNVRRYTMADTSEDVEFEIDTTATFLRVDLGTEKAYMEISDLSILTAGEEIAFDIQKLETCLVEQEDISELEFTDTGMKIRSEGSDPYLLFDIQSFGLEAFAEQQEARQIQRTKIMACTIFDLLILVVYFLFPTTFITPFEVLVNRNLLFRLAQNDFVTRYAGSYFGLFWAFVQPCVTILLYWFVFQVGLGSGPVEGYPFVIWLISGLIPWMFFQDAVLYGTNSLIEYSYLVKKVVFEIDILPMVKIISAFFVHVFFWGISILLFSAMGYFPGWYCIQMLYYSLCTGVLAIAVSYCTSAVILFFRDLGQIINIVLQVGTWMTPILWQIKMIPENLRWIFRLNPMYYVVQGYRDSVLSHTWFFERLSDTAYFWFFVIVLFIIGNNIFQRLKPHFADVL